MNRGYRIGHGIDVHPFRRGRKLILGGVEIPHPFGLGGHSDADVVLHALMNALLGAMGKGDIGTHFPDTDPRYKGISSARLLERVMKMMEKAGFRIVNGDITVLAQKPRLAPFFAPKVNVKAVTTEKLGWIGAGRGMVATAVVLLAKTARRS